jgi:hypothetical protein
MPAPGLTADAVSELERLLWYDAQWTGYAANPRLVRSNPLDAIDVALKFASAINSARSSSVSVAVSLAPGDSYQELPASLVELLSDLEDGRIVLDAVARHSGVVALANDGASDIAESAPEALEMLENDLRSLFSGEAAAGYLPRRFLCGLAGLSMAAGLVTVWVPPHAHAAPAVALGATVYKTAGCTR